MKMLILLLVTSLAIESLACTCLPNPPTSEALEKADLVFTGQVVDVDLIATEQEIPKGVDQEILKEIAEDSGAKVKGGKLISYSRLYVFRLTEIFKGAKNEEISVITEMTPEACGYDFQLKGNYLVYAYADGDRFRTSICTRTKGLAAESPKNEDELRTLRMISRTTAPVSK